MDAPKNPSRLRIILTLLGLVGLLGLGLVGMAGLPAFGYTWVSFAAIGGVLLGILLRKPLRLSPIATATTSRPRWFRRLLLSGRWVLIGFLACWLALFLWLAFCPDSPPPPVKARPELVRVVTWNIHCGQDRGLPWKQFDWPARKHALQTALDEARPDILCVQEATPEQVAFLEAALVGHRRVGNGREGEAGGEHCAIFFARERFTELAGSTFWLEEPIDQPRVGWGLDIKRICTWVRLQDKISGRTFRVYNTHLYLTETPRQAAAKIILDQVAAGDPHDPVVLTADFNTEPSVPSRRLFTEAGLADSAERVGEPVGKPTFQLYGIGLWCIDGILVDSHWRVGKHLVLKNKPHNKFPSDHFGLMADLELAE